MEQIKSGNFSNVEDLDKDTLSILNDAYARQTNSKTIKWVECDLNSNGLKGLAWQDGDWPYSDVSKILCIFAFKDGKVMLVMADFVDHDFYFISDNGNIIYVYLYGGTTSDDSYYHYEFDEHGQKFVSGLYVLTMYDWYINQLKEAGEYDENSPTAKAGSYYYRVSFDSAGRYQKEEITKQQFLKEFKAMTGQSFYDSPVTRRN